ncbi:YA60 [Enterospora canceri]|uniref:YA60 n=1 Tax=Enterospora canceri TaxID=1081671 RepID=A0A1Y1S5X8_9MICR|nr:YA60 [Enterospora canceri]
MKFMEITHILKTNELFKKYMEFVSGKLIEIEAYSCKKSKEERMIRRIKKPLRFFISALEMSFIHYDFSKLNMGMFEKVDFNAFCQDLYNFMFYVCKCKDEANECIEYVKLVLQHCVNVDGAAIYGFKFHGDEPGSVYLIYNKSMKRILLVKTLDRQNITLNASYYVNIML